MRTAGYGHFMGMFHVGNLAHDKVMASKQMFAKHVMPKLRPINEEAGGLKLRTRPQPQALSLKPLVKSQVSPCIATSTT